jgi:N6-L-threonylcarbamoyladenine synthase
MLVLGIETSCDETAAAIVKDGKEILSNIVASQFDIHRKYGGVVPELACRRHLENIIPVIDQALVSANTSLAEIDLLAVTQGPGLIGALLVGLSTAKAIAYAYQKPLVGINHLAGHIYSAFLEYPKLPFPFLALVASGGHTELYRIDNHGEFCQLGTTLDDAAGEAFDKVAKMLGLGYPGGPVIDKYAQQGNSQAIAFPRPNLNKNSLDFSFSGLKTAVSLYLKKKRPEITEAEVADIAASFQQAVVDVLVAKTLDATRQIKVNSIILVGGVACNSLLRKEMISRCQEINIPLFYPPPPLCTDNAAMIACAAYYIFCLRGIVPPFHSDYLEMDAVADLTLA